ncbi:MAG: B12-binding domain-containing radical SAM protein [Polyangiales bacterium]
MRVLLVSANRERLPSPVVPIGVLSVAASVRDAHEVEVLDLCFEGDPEQALRSAIGRFSPEIVGIGLRNLHTNAYDGTERLIDEYAALVRVVREACRAKIVLGGSGFSLQPSTLLDRIGGDHGVVGEGERSFRDLVDRLSRGEEVPRLVHGPAVATVGLRTSKIRSDLDLLPPPARDLVDPRYVAFDGTANLQSKRGCAFQCSYCDYPDLEGRKVRVRDPEAVAAELEGLARTPGVTHAFFVDSVFNVPPAHARAVCDAIIARGSPIPWVGYVSPVALDDALVSAMARAGCVGAEIGTDTGSANMLRRLRKPFTLADVEESRALFLRHDLLDCHTFVLGAEGETAEEARETLRFVDRLAPDVAVFIVFMEDRESRTPHRAAHRAELLELLASEAPKRPGWVVPELDIRFGDKVTRVVQRTGLRGPSWLHLARSRRPAVA